MVVSICALLVSTLALAFTVTTFWWLNARRGRLRAYRPHSFAALLGADDLLLTLPLVFHNDGPAPIVVQDLRLRLDKTEEEMRQEHRPSNEPVAPPLRMWWRATRPAVQPESGSRPMPAAFPVDGRKAVQVFIEFGLSKPAYVPRSGPYRAVVEAKLGHRAEWLDVLIFDLHTEQVKADAGYIAYSNDPEWEP